jgi:hypothetical protein
MDCFVPDGQETITSFPNGYGRSNLISTLICQFGNGQRIVNGMVKSFMLFVFFTMVM